MNTQRPKSWPPRPQPAHPSTPSITPTLGVSYSLGTTGRGIHPLWMWSLVLLGVLLLTACGAPSAADGARGSGTPLGATATSTSARAKLQIKMPNTVQNPYPYAAVEFDRGTPYAQALRSVTDLGLIPLAPCTSGSLGVGIKWQPSGQLTTYATPLPAPNGPSLWVFGPTPYDTVNVPSAPPDWLARLVNSSSIRNIYDEATNCPLLPGPSGTPAYLPPNATFVYLRASFSVATSYDATLDAITNLGFRLADPCYEQAQPKPAWHSMGQEQSFATTHALVLSTTYANSTQWRQQLAAIAGVMTIQAPYTAPC